MIRILYYLQIGFVVLFFLGIWLGVKYGFIKTEEELFNLLIAVPVAAVIIFNILTYLFRTKEQRKTPSRPREHAVMSLLKLTFGEDIQTRKLNKKMPGWRAWLVAIIMVIVGFALLCLALFLADLLEKNNFLNIRFNLVGAFITVWICLMAVIIVSYFVYKSTKK